MFIDSLSDPFKGEERQKWTMEKGSVPKMTYRYV